MTKNKKGGINPLAAAVVGAAVGAAAVVLSDPKKRKQIKDKAQQLKEKGSKEFEKARQKLEEAEEKGKRRLTQELDKVTSKVKKS